jgi:hypothetical protein
MVSRYQHITRQDPPQHGTRLRAVLPDGAADVSRVRPQAAIETGGPADQNTGYRPRSLSSLVNQLAEDKRFELLRVSPTRFPIMLLTVQWQSGVCVTRQDGNWAHGPGRC